MTELIDFAKIRELSDDYYQQRISKQEYRRQRTEILNKIDEELNGLGPVERTDDAGPKFVGRLMAFFKNTDEEKIV